MSERLSTQQLEELREKAAKATPGPWFADTGDIISESRLAVIERDSDDDSYLVCADANINGNADFIASADPQTLTALVDEVLRLRSEGDDLYAACIEPLGFLIDCMGSKNLPQVASDAKDLKDKLDEAMQPWRERASKVGTP